MKYPLMRNNILREDLDAVIAHLQQDDPILTSGAKVREFEAAWSAWLGVKYSVFVNSGSSANLISMGVLKQRHPEGGEVIVPPLTWISDIASVMHYGFTPVFVDIDPLSLAMDADQVIEQLSDKTRAVFLTHAQGFDGLEDRLLDELRLRQIPLIEDVCESHGACHGPDKAGALGWMSNFSFYYAHHLSTIEGGMVCTNDESVYQQARLLRAHGMVRESDDLEFRDHYVRAHPDLNPAFIFAMPGYNMRNNEIGGILGLSQLKRLDEGVAQRNRNLLRLLDNLDSRRFRTEFKLEGCSNYAFNVILREPDTEFTTHLMQVMDEAGIEYRRGSAGGGNQLRQPYLQDRFGHLDLAAFPEVEHVHFHGFYLGNYPDLKEREADEIAQVLNSA